jgi:hypothetical protein
VSHRFHRRQLIGSAGTAIGLPFLASLVPRRSRGAAKPPLRFIAVSIPNGVVHKQWDPAVTGAGWSLPPTLQPLAPVKEHVLVVTGLGKAIDGHKPGTGTILTEKNVGGGDVTEMRNDISIDQLLASRFGDKTVLPSLQLGGEPSRNTGSCGFSGGRIACSYETAISWAGSGKPLPKITDPKVAFDRLFAGSDPGASAQERLLRAARRKSVIDCARDESKRLESVLGRDDRIKMDEYLSGIADLETRLFRVSDAGAACGGARAPAAALEFHKVVEAMQDLMVLAIRCDRTRFITFMYGNALSARSMAFLGEDGAHHPVSHHRGNFENLRKLAVMERWEISMFARLLQGLKAAPDLDGSPILDNMAVFLSSDISDGDKHDGVNMPVIVAGKLGGALKSDRHLRFSGKKIGHLFVSLAQGFGLPLSRFGDTGDGPLDLS